MNNKGFTLIEIIIVIVILGVLATLALPRLTAQVTASEASEAMQLLGAIKRATLNCYDAGGNFSGCNDANEIGVASPLSSSKFAVFVQDSAGSPAISSASTSILWTARSRGTTANYIQLLLTNQGAASLATPATGPYRGIISKTNTTFATVVFGTATAYSF